MKKKIRKRAKGSSLKGILVKGYLEKVSSKLFELIEDELNDLLKGHSGIYVLYKNDDIYYVGLTKRLHGRIKHHLVDRHQNKWNKFSLYKIRKTKYLKDIETLILRLIRPRGNKLIGNFRKENDLKPALKKKLEEFLRELTGEIK